MSLKGINCHFNWASSELYVAYKATKNKFIVSYPLFTQSKYDLLIDTNKKINIVFVALRSSYDS